MLSILCVGRVIFIRYFYCFLLLLLAQRRDPMLLILCVGRVIFIHYFYCLFHYFC